MTSRACVCGLLLVVLLARAASAQNSPIAQLTPEQRTARDTVEDRLADVLSRSWNEAQLPKIKRTKQRKYREIVCSLAVEKSQGETLHESPTLRGFFVERDIAQDLQPRVDKWIAGEKAILQKNRKEFWVRRFDVAAWPTGDGAYVVNFDFLMSTLGEMVGNNMTDQVFYKSEWKKGIVPQCKHAD